MTQVRTCPHCGAAGWRYVERILDQLPPGTQWEHCTAGAGYHLRIPGVDDAGHRPTCPWLQTKGQAFCDCYLDQAGAEQARAEMAAAQEELERRLREGAKALPLPGLIGGGGLVQLHNPAYSAAEEERARLRAAEEEAMREKVLARIRPYDDPPERCPACGLSDPPQLEAVVPRPASSPFSPRFIPGAEELGRPPHLEWTCCRCGYSFLTRTKEPVA